MVGAKKRGFELDPSQNPRDGRTPKRRRCGSSLISSVIKINRQNQGITTPFGEVPSRLTSEHINANIKAEARKLHLSSDGTPANIDAANPSLHSSSQKNASGLHSRTCTEQPLFTLQQINLIYQRRVKERENEIREEYERILRTRMSEQYDTFVKFTYDQIEKRFENCTSSYLS